MSYLQPGTKVTILMDVDGVLNDFHTPNDPKYRIFDAENGFRIAWDETVMERLLAWHEKGLVEIKWLTTWCHDANKMLRTEFGFTEDLEVVGYDHWLRPGTHWSDWWKLKAVREYVNHNPDEFIVWIDDEHRWQNETIEFVGSEPNIHAISPYPSLSHKDLDQIESWITQ